MVEQGTENPRVRGSTPFPATSKRAGQGTSCSGLLSYVCNAICNPSAMLLPWFAKDQLAESRARPCGTTAATVFGPGRAKGRARCAYPRPGARTICVPPRRCNGGNDSPPNRQAQWPPPVGDPRPRAWCPLDTPRQGYPRFGCPCPNSCLAHGGARPIASPELTETHPTPGWDTIGVAGARTPDTPTRAPKGYNPLRCFGL